MATKAKCRVTINTGNLIGSTLLLSGFVWIIPTGTQGAPDEHAPGEEGGCTFSDASCFGKHPDRVICCQILPCNYTQDPPACAWNFDSPFVSYAPTYDRDHYGLGVNMLIVGMVIMCGVAHLVFVHMRSVTKV